jgi:hypothetical protein
MSMRMTFAARGAAASARIDKVSFAYRGRAGQVGEVVGELFRKR